MRALSMTLSAERRLLRKDGLHRCFSLQAPSGEELVARELLPAHFASPPTLEKWLGLVERNAHLSLPGCTQVEDWGVQGDAALVVSRAPSGVPLAALMESVRALNGAQAAQLVAYVGVSVLEVLERAQQVDPTLFHLDLDPENIIVQHDGSLLLTELGLWTALVPSDMARGRFDSGRVHYCSPELVQSRVADARSDLFSIGVVLYRMLAGELPFVGATQLLIAMAIAEGQRSPLRSKAPEDAGDLCDVIEVMLATSPEERFQTAAAAKSALLTTLRTARETLAAELARLVQPLASAASTASARPPLVSSGHAAVQAQRPSRGEATRLHVAMRPSQATDTQAGRPQASSGQAPPPPAVSTSVPPGIVQAGPAYASEGASSEPQPPPLFMAPAASPAAPAMSLQPSTPAVRVSQPAVLLAPDPAALNPLRPNDGRTSHLKVPPSALSRPLLDVVPPPPSPPLVPPSMEAYPPASLRLPDASPQGPSFRDPEARRSAQPASSPFEASWAAPKHSSRWRDPSDTVFQMKNRSTGTPKKEGKSSLVSVVLLSTFVGFLAVVGLYLAYRLL